MKDRTIFTFQNSLQNCVCLRSILRGHSDQVGSKNKFIFLFAKNVLQSEENTVEKVRNCYRYSNSVYGGKKVWRLSRTYVYTALH